MQRSLLSIRSAFILLLAMLTGIGAAVLLRLAGTPTAQCLLYAAGAFGVAVPFFDRLVAGPDDEHPQSPS